jgi:rSAM/selenodomain-associated transferase 2/rSAM/selenodomain-associated transferase 1
MPHRLILMLKYPTPGTVKTRLAPALGPQRACALHRALVRQTLTEVERFASAASVAVEVRLAGAPDPAAERAWLGEGVVIRGQGDGDLGDRMDRAVTCAFTEGAGAVVVIGGDCPQLTAEHLDAAFAALAHSDAVLGPAADGGYYLIGQRRPLSALFQGIRWGSTEVLAQTLAVARAQSITVAQLATLHDIDLPEDLPHWAKTPAARAAGRSGLSVIIPALNEEAQLGATLLALQRDPPHEIIVADGGSIDRTVEVARAHDAIVLPTAGGRGRQMNFGAEVATGGVLLFLHADTILPANYLELIRATLARPGLVGGAFQFALEGAFTGRRLIERSTNWRARVRQMPYGDQGLFLRREVFDQVGGFPDQPIMEDYEFVRRLRRLGGIAIADGTATTSGRRWQRLGPWRTTLINSLMVLGYRIGVSPARLAKWYRRPGQSRAGTAAILGNKRPASVI